MFGFLVLPLYLSIQNNLFLSHRYHITIVFSQAIRYYNIRYLPMWRQRPFKNHLLVSSYYVQVHALLMTLLIIGYKEPYLYYVTLILYSTVLLPYRYVMTMS